MSVYVAQNRLMDARDRLERLLLTMRRENDGLARGVITDVIVGLKETHLELTATASSVKNASEIARTFYPPSDDPAEVSARTCGEQIADAIESQILGVRR